MILQDMEDHECQQ